MASVGILHEAFIDESRDSYDAERQLLKALPKLAKASTSAELREAFEAHLEETRGHVERLEQILEEDFDETTMDACLIAAGQRAEYYEMAASAKTVTKPATRAAGRR
jgi:ferritin-like metal-binding protein YciE